MIRHMEDFHYQYTLTPKSNSSASGSQSISRNLKKKTVVYSAGDIEDPANQPYICELLRETYANAPMIS